MTGRLLLGAVVVSARLAGQPVPSTALTGAAEVAAMQALRARLVGKRIGLDTAELDRAVQTSGRGGRRADALRVALGASPVARGFGRACIAHVTDDADCRTNVVDVVVTLQDVRVTGDTAWVDVILTQGVPNGVGVRAGTPFSTTVRMHLLRIGSRWQPGAWTRRSIE